MLHLKSDILSVNLEDYFQVAPFRKAIPRRHWPRFDLRIEQSAMATLDMLDRHKAKATFFTLGWLADRRPDLIREIAARGHELASKGYYHSRFQDLTLDEFRDDALRSRDAIETAAGRQVLGFRIGEGSLPADPRQVLSILAAAGFQYDSSLRPFGAPFAGQPQMQDIRHISEDGWSMWEVPFSSASVLGIPVPVTGGNYLRQMPDWLFGSLTSLRRAQTKSPWHFYFHAWEMDAEQPRISAVSSFSRLRQYRNLASMPERIEAIVAANAFAPVAAHLGLAAAPVSRQAAPEPIIVAAKAPAKGRKKATVVVPCYFEEDTLPYLSGTLASFAEKNRDTLELSYVFVDDGSSDGTWRVLNELFGDRPDCTLVRHEQNQGIAAATMTGIRAAKDEIVCGIDCDCSFDPHTLADMIPLLTDGVDMVQASPYHKDGGVLNVPEWRLVLSRNLSRMYRVLLNHRFASYTACFRVYRRSSIKNMELVDKRFLGIAEMFIRLDQNNARIVEFPTVLESRLIGHSKMKTVPVIMAHLGMVRRLAGAKLKSFFMPDKPGSADKPGKQIKREA